MFFKNQNSSYDYGDHRVIRKFAYFPTQVRDYAIEGEPIVGTVWLEEYDIVQKYYRSAGWDTQHRAVAGTGRFAAESYAKLWGGRVIQ